MKKRSPLAVVLLSIVTFGIYDLYWLVVTKKVLNQKTRHHTPTIWLLIVPYVILSAGYILLFAGSILDASRASKSAPSPTTIAGSNEQLNNAGERRPTQYTHRCTTTDGKEYVAQGDPQCLGNDTYKGDYSTSAAGTVYSSPCKTTSGELRYVYISTDESCPDGTKLVFYNNIFGFNNSSNNSYGSSRATSNDSNDDITAHGSLYLWSLGLIVIGFITTFATSIFWFFQFSKAINEYTRGKMNTAVTFLILWLIHLIGVALIQDTFNEMDDPAVGGSGTPMAPMTPVPGFASHPSPNVQQPHQPMMSQPPQTQTATSAVDPQSRPPHQSPHPPHIDKPANQNNADNDHFGHTL